MKRMKITAIMCAFLAVFVLNAQEEEKKGIEWKAEKITDSSQIVQPGNGFKLLEAINAGKESQEVEVGEIIFKANPEKSGKYIDFSKFNVGSDEKTTDSEDDDLHDLLTTKAYSGSSFAVIELKNLVPGKKYKVVVLTDCDMFKDDNRGHKMYARSRKDRTGSEFIKEKDGSAMFVGTFTAGEKPEKITPWHFKGGASFGAVALFVEDN